MNQIPRVYLLVITLFAGTTSVCVLNANCREATQTEASFQKARLRLVELLKDDGIYDLKVLKSISAVPRHKFVPERLHSHAYGNYPLPIGRGQTISQPYIVAYMTQALALKGGEKVLEVGTGSGYQAAVLAEMGVLVYTVEIIPELSRRATKVLKELGYKKVWCKTGDGYDGWSEQAPFDAIIITAAPVSIPKPLISQLKVGGRLVLPIGEPSSNQMLYTYKKNKKGLLKIDSLPVRFVPMTGKAEQK